jgi:hypothetical protein
MVCNLCFQVISTPQQTDALEGILNIIINAIPIQCSRAWPSLSELRLVVILKPATINVNLQTEISRNALKHMNV